MYLAILLNEKPKVHSRHKPKLFIEVFGARQTDTYGNLINTDIWRQQQMAGIIDAIR